MFRRFHIGDFSFIKHEFARQFAREQWDVVVQLFKNNFTCDWINHPDKIAMASDRGKQLSMARAIGFNVPNTLITNDPAAANEFYFGQNARIVIKALNHHGLEISNDYYAMYTHFVIPKDLQHFEDLIYAPCVIQEWIDKKYELRVTVLADHVYAAKIDLQSSASAKIDIHRAALASLPKEAIEMTEKDCQRCVSLIRELGLTYGAIDFLIDDKNRLVFLEVNPVGDWAWLEQQTGLRITEAIADFIEKKVN